MRPLPSGARVGGGVAVGAGAGVTTPTVGAAVAAGAVVTGKVALTSADVPAAGDALAVADATAVGVAVARVGIVGTSVGGTAAPSGAPDGDGGGTVLVAAGDAHAMRSASVERRAAVVSLGTRSGFRDEPQRYRVHAMPSVLRREPLTVEDMAEVSAAGGTLDLHARAIRIREPPHGTWDLLVE